MLQGSEDPQYKLFFLEDGSKDPLPLAQPFSFTFSVNPRTFGPFNPLICGGSEDLCPRFLVTKNLPKFFLRIYQDSNKQFK